MASIQHVGAIIEDHLNEISHLFKPGAKLTLLVRNEIEGKDADFVMTTDALPLAIEALQRREALL